MVVEFVTHYQFLHHVVLDTHGICVKLFFRELTGCGGWWVQFDEGQDGCYT
jgi:hypothetical protein